MVNVSRNSASFVRCNNRRCIHVRPPHRRSFASLLALSTPISLFSSFLLIELLSANTDSSAVKVETPIVRYDRFYFRVGRIASSLVLSFCVVDSVLLLHSVTTKQ